MKKRFAEAQIVGFLREADAGVPVKDLCQKHGFSEGSYDLRRSKFGGMGVSDAKAPEGTRDRKPPAQEIARGVTACLRIGTKGQHVTATVPPM